MWNFTKRNPVTESVQAKVNQSFAQMGSRDDLGFKDLGLLEQSVSKVKQHLRQYSQPQRVVVIGIGGSALGAKAFCEAIKPLDWSNQVLYLDNVDALMMVKKLQFWGRAEEAIWVVISKSGGTIETLSTYNFCRLLLLKSTGVDIVQNTIVVTEEKESPLFDFAREYDRPLLAVPASVGGRFSVFTVVGLLPLGIIGVNLQEILAGAQLAVHDGEKVKHLSCELLTSLIQNEYNFYLFAYSDRLEGFGKWLQQLWSESLAKATNRNHEPGPIVSSLVPLRGASDQHSVLQQIMEGREKKFVCFLRDHEAEQADWVIDQSVFKNDIMLGKHLGHLLAAEAQATADALAETGIRSLAMSSSVIDAKSLSYLMMLWMLTVATLGEALNINAFDQPGVESGKRLARRVLRGSH